MEVLLATLAQEGMVPFCSGGNRRLELTAGYRLTTNNRMELLAVIVALEALKREGTEVWVVSDSKYVIDSVVKGWVFNWEKKGYKGKKNPDLWMRFLKVYRKHKVRFDWVKGHAGNPMNERADHLGCECLQEEGPFGGRWVRGPLWPRP